jgi:hypothetical protein
MNHDDSMIADVLRACDERRDARRAFLRTAGQASFVAAGAAVLAACDDSNDDIVVRPTPTPSPTPTPTPSPTTPAPSVQDVLNFALNLEYLEAQFYSFAAFGTGLADNLLGGTGTQGAVRGGRRVAFSDPAIARFAREIAQDEVAHVAFLRQALGTSAIAQPQINLGTGSGDAFSAAARAAGLIGESESFDPFSSDENFLLGAFLFEDVGVTAYKGSSPLLISNKPFLEAAAGILAVEAYHAAMIRTTLYRKGVETPTLIDKTEAISNARDALDGTSDIDQGIRSQGTGADQAANIVPTDGNAVAFSRTPGQVLNIVYLNKAAVEQGGFFPAGVNGAVRLSQAN